MPYGGLNMAAKACSDNGYEIDPEIAHIFTEYRKTHNQGVFDVYTHEMRLARTNKILTGLPDAYGRGRIIGDYRRVALYGVDKLIEDKKAQKEFYTRPMTEEKIRAREEIADQLRARLTARLKLQADRAALRESPTDCSNVCATLQMSWATDR